MEKYAILLGYYDKQLKIILKLHLQIIKLDLSSYEQGYVFALKTQQFYTAVEDLLKQIAKSFENHIQDLSSYHKEILIRLNTAIPNIRPEVISNESFLLLDKLRAFRHFIRHAYDCELSKEEMVGIQQKIQNQFHDLEKDLSHFREFVEKLSL